MTDMFCKETGW